MLNAGEFIQMSGRAGRRNYDKNGFVIISSPIECEKEKVVHLLESKAEALNSEFRVTFHMILSLLQTNQMNPEQLMNQSFSSVSNGKRNLIEEEINKLGSQLIDEVSVKMKNETERLISNHLKT